MKITREMAIEYLETEINKVEIKGPEDVPAFEYIGQLEWGLEQIKAGADPEEILNQM